MLSAWCLFFGAQEICPNAKDAPHEMPLFFAYILLAVAALLWMCRHQLGRIFFSPSKSVLDWTKSRLPGQWSTKQATLSGGLHDLWQDGSLLCALINSAIPEACSDPHRHFNKPPAHAQELALKYFGINPVFTEENFSLPWSPQLETQLLNHLLLLQKRIRALEHSKPPSQVASTFHVRGMGLYTAEQFKEANFFIYSLQGNFLQLEVAILGPFGSQCRTSFQDLLANIHLKSSTNTIKIQMLVEETRLKISYVPQHCGIHEIRLSCNQESLEGSPYHVKVLNYSLFKCKGSAMAISKYLKELTNTREKLQTQRGSYWNIQKLVDSSFRVACKVTRASPALRAGNLAQFSSSYPVCERHTAAEDCRKVSMDDRRKIFFTHTQVGPEVGAFTRLLNHMSKEAPAEDFLGNNQRLALQRTVLEKKVFWESAFDQPKLESVEDIQQSWNRRLKHVDSLYLLRKRPVSKSMSNLNWDGKQTVEKPRWYENYLDLCGRISLDERLKPFMRSSRQGEASGLGADKSRTN